MAGPIQRLTISSRAGSFTIDAGGAVSADQFLFVTDLDRPVAPPGNPQLRSWSFDQNLLNPPASATGVFDLAAHNVLPLPPTSPQPERIQIVLDTVLQAQSVAGGSAFIELAGPLRIDVIVPEPASAAAMAVCLLLRRRRPA